MLPVLPVVLGLFLQGVGVGHLAGADTPGALREVYLLGTGGGSLTELTNATKFPSSPDVEEVVTSMEAPAEWGDSYGQRLRALVVPPVTGDYVFSIASDDQGALFLSSTENPAQRTLIASVNAWTAFREWTKEANQVSSAIRLEFGKRYYLEALQCEGGGGDNLSVRWQLPNGVVEEPIPSQRLVAYGLGAPVISGQPVDLNLVEGSLATFTLGLARRLGAVYQWQKNGVNMPGETFSNLVVGPVVLADSGAGYRCIASNGSGSVTSRVARLTVTQDVTAPTLLSVQNLGAPQIVTAQFSEPLDPITAAVVSNYQIAPGIRVLRARLNDDGRSVVLETDPMSKGVMYTLSVQNVRDRASQPNTVAPGTSKPFTLDYTLAPLARLLPPVEPLGPSSRRSGLVISEVMYHPMSRADLRNLEYLEIYNSQEWSEDISEYRLTGDVDFTFPTNTVLGAKSFVVVAASAADMTAVYGFSTGLYQYEGRLPNDGGTIRLRNRWGALLQEMEYASEAPWPVGADGGGHSLTLLRPSLGVGNPDAWGLSDRVGGTPKAAHVATTDTHRSLWINEFLAHTDDPVLDYVELFNFSNATLDLRGIVITDDPTTNKYVFPAGMTIGPRGFVVVDQSQLGFSLSAAGETLWLKNTNATRVLDAVRFRGQENGVSTGRYPDGGPGWSEMARRTPGAPNAEPLQRPVVINEIMYRPVTGDDNEEYVELRNRGVQPQSLAGWKLSDAVDYRFPEGSIIPAGGYVVVARNPSRLAVLHPGLGAGQLLGDYSGNLSNNGEELRLTMPDEVVSTNAAGRFQTNIIHIVVDQVDYRSGGRWGRWSDGGGSSLELRDPRGDHRRAPSWGESDETGKSDWVTVEHTGVLDLGNTAADSLQIFLMGPGECLVDDVEVIPQGGGNLVANGQFASGMDGWVAQGNQDRSTWQATGGVGGSGCLHLRATGRGDTGANRVRVKLTTAPGEGTVATLRARVRWLKGSPDFLMRLHGNWLEATGYLLTTRSFGTPGRANSAAIPNAPPAIWDVTHTPILPAASASVVVTARLQDPDGLAQLSLRYRVDPSTNLIDVPMTYSGAGLYSGTIPGQAAGKLVAFHISAQDFHETPATATFPSDAPVRECLVRFGDPVNSGNFGHYRVWLTEATIARWSQREKLSNDSLDATFVYGNSRVVYNAGAQYSGSPYHSPGYNSPIGNPCDYVLNFPADDAFLEESDLNLVNPGNGCCDGSLQREQVALGIAQDLGLPAIYRRYVKVLVNGNQRGTLMEDIQQPNRNMADQWYPDGGGGNLHKIQLWFEFDDQASSFAAVGASLGNYLTTNNERKLARYRWNWAARAFRETPNNYTNLYRLMDAVTTSATGDEFTRIISSQMDVDNWARTMAVERIVNNGDSYGVGGQNMFTYKPSDDTWKLMIWDIDFAFAVGNPTDELFGFSDYYLGRILDHPPFARAYWRAYQDAVNGPLVASRINPQMNARYNAFVQAGLSPEDPSGIQNYVAQRRTFIQSRLVGKNPAFAASVPSSWSTNASEVEIRGLAPLNLVEMTVNGIVQPVTWTTLSNWVIRVALRSGENVIVLGGLDIRGRTIPSIASTHRITYTGAPPAPDQDVMISEIQFDPAVPGTSFLELFNRSAVHTYDLAGWRVRGLDYTFNSHALLGPQKRLVLVRDRFAFSQLYGDGVPVFDEFSGGLDNDGELLQLIRPGVGDTNTVVVSEVEFESRAPWPQTASGTGASLQLVDVNQSESRVANWRAIVTYTNEAPRTLVTWTQTWRYNQTDNLDGVPWMDRVYDDSGWPSGQAALYKEEASLAIAKNTPLILGKPTYYFRTRFDLPEAPVGASLKLNTLVDDGVVFYLNGVELHRLRMEGNLPGYNVFASPGVGDATLEGPFVLPAQLLRQGENVLAAEVHQSGAASSDVVFAAQLETTYDTVVIATPGQPNSAGSSLDALPPVALNEIYPFAHERFKDASGEPEPWVELYNATDGIVSLQGLGLVTNLTQGIRWDFPASASIGPRQFLRVILDGEPGESTPSEWHASIRPLSGRGFLALVRGQGAGLQVVDYLRYPALVEGRSYGALPDGRWVDRRSFYVPTPAAANDVNPPPIQVVINEWMADNQNAFVDPADGDYEDWFELYNAGSTTADLGGYFLSDSSTNATLWRIPQGIVIPPQGFLLVWADGETKQNAGTGSVHAGFKLSAEGDEVVLWTPDGHVVDGVRFGAQVADRSQGHARDGLGDDVNLPTATPGASNNPAPVNQAPSLIVPGPFSLFLGETWTARLTATDPDLPPQNLTFQLLTGAPEGLVLDAGTGDLTWTPGEAALGLHQVGVRVLDDGRPVASADGVCSIRVYRIPSVQGVRVTDEGDLELRWDAVAGRSYRVEFKNTLTDAVWKPLGAVLKATGNELTITDLTQNQQQRFYRIRVEP